MKNKKQHIIETQFRVEYCDFYVLIVPNLYAGKKDAYTVYKIPTNGSRHIKIIGRELPLNYARAIAAGPEAWESFVAKQPPKAKPKRKTTKSHDEVGSGGGESNQRWAFWTDRKKIAIPLAPSEYRR